ncbi:MAG: TolC family protein [candidate division KSB1 bacterium]|nr:TolC family protein [candidate division KSB1 bacterium]
MKRLMYTGLCIIFLISVSLQAQEPMVLTLDKSVSIALENNPGYQSAEKQVQKAEAGVWEAYSQVLPQVNANANVQHNWDIQTTRMPNFLKPALPDQFSSQMPDYIEVAFGLENSFRYGANLQQPLFLGGAGLSGIQMALAGVKAAEYDKASRKQSLIYNSTQAFYSCILAKELVTVQEEALEQAKANLNVVTKKYNAGTASRFDKMRAEVNVANTEPQAISARNNYQIALTQLRMVLGLPRNQELKVDGNLLYEQESMAEMTLSDLKDKALQYRPEVQAFHEQRYIAKKGITAARSAFMPKLIFQTDYSYMANQNDWKLNQNEFSKGFTSSISLQVPLFSGFKNNKSYQKAKLDYKIVLDHDKQLKDGIVAEVEMSYNNLQEAGEKYQAAAQSVELAQESYRLANMMYEEGASTQLDVWAAQSAMTQAQLNELRSLFDYQMARYELRKATGTLTGLLE